MQDKTIDNALLALRKQIIREGKQGLDHVEALLGMRGVHMPLVLPGWRKDVARKGVMSALELDALRGGPKTAIEVTVYVMPRRPELTPEAAKKRTALVLSKLKMRGLVVKDFGPDGCLWRIAPN